ncbi:MAG: hypothetical protein RL328_1305 [Acidobacteriota bacterium]|jgi:hypothetical protein
MKIRMLLCSLLLTAASAFAADVDGKWSGNLDTPNGAVPVACAFKAEGATLNGSMSGPDGAEIKIAGGMIDGNKFSFTLTIDFGGMPVVMNYTGVVTGNDLTMTTEIFGMPLQFSLKKVAA